MSEPKLDEGVIVRFSVRFLLLCSSALVSVVLIFASIRNDLVATINQVGNLASIIKDDQKAIRDLQMDLLSTRDDLRNHVQRYERDMNTYVREHPERGK